jgi:hypothetical protein
VLLAATLAVALTLPSATLAQDEPWVIEEYEPYKEPADAD